MSKLFPETIFILSEKRIR